ncbi:MAG: MXAN_5187 C-terminal domain-containing protein [Acidobacteriota bacterium]
MNIPAWDRELRVLEEALRRLNAEYDAFLYGTTVVKPPQQSRKKVQEMFRQLNALDSMPAAERFRLTTLQGRYAILTERWDRLQGEKEAGRRPGLYGHFGETGPSTPAAPNTPPPASVQEEHRAVPGGSERDLFERYLAAKKARGEDVSGYRLSGFLEGLERERRKAGERLGGGEIVFDVAERDGRVRLIAKKKPRGTG